jgi:hypothetical protein
VGGSELGPQRACVFGGVQAACSPCVELASKSIDKMLGALVVRHESGLRASPKLHAIVKGVSRQGSCKRGRRMWSK